MNKRGNYNNTPTERGCCHQPEPVLFSSPEKIRTGNENGRCVNASYVCHRQVVIEGEITIEKSRTTGNSIVFV